VLPLAVIVDKEELSAQRGWNRRAKETGKEHEKRKEKDEGFGRG